MKETPRKRFLKLLTSGRWLEDPLYLKRGRIRRSALGILCEAYAEASKERFHLPPDETVPPDYVRQWAGLTADEHRYLAQACSQGASFAEIAREVKTWR